MATRLTFSFYGDKQIDRTLLRRAEAAQDATPVWEVLADRFLDVETRQFASQGAYGSGGWPPLSPRYGAWKAIHYPGAPILVRTGDLRDALTQRDAEGSIRAITPSAMAVGADVDYGRYHQRGEGNLPRRRPVEFPDTERQAWVKAIHRFLVTSEATV